MKRSGFFILGIALFVSLVFHLALFRLVHYEKKSEDRDTQRYEVNLVYYEKPEKHIASVKKPAAEKKIRPKKSVKKKKQKEQQREEKEPEQQPVQKEADAPDQPRVHEDADISELPPEKIQREEPLGVENSGTSLKNRPFKEPSSSAGVLQEQPDYTRILSGLRDNLLKRKIYPYAARKKGFEGVAVVFVRLDADGNPLNIRLSHSSGYRVLDTAALSLVKKVLPYRHNTGHVISFEIPIKYNLVE